MCTFPPTGDYSYDQYPSLSSEGDEKENPEEGEQEEVPGKNEKNEHINQAR